MSEHQPSCSGYKKYRMTLEVEIDVPQHSTNPSLTLTPTEIRQALLQCRNRGYAVCAPTSDDPLRTRKLTADMRILSATFAECPTCGISAKQVTNDGA